MNDFIYELSEKYLCEKNDLAFCVKVRYDAIFHHLNLFSESRKRFITKNSVKYVEHQN